MEGRFKPGRDLSLDWIADAEPPSAPAKPAAKDGAPTAKPALDVARAAAGTKRSAALVYFYSSEDLAKPEAKALQNEVFFDADVRAAAKPLVAVKLDRAKYDAAFNAFGLTSTPSLVVVDAEFNVIERFEGAVTAKSLAKSLAKAATKK